MGIFFIMSIMGRYTQLQQELKTLKKRFKKVPLQDTYDKMIELESRLKAIDRAIDRRSINCLSGNYSNSHLR